MSNALEQGKKPAVRKSEGRVYQTERTATAKALMQQASATVEEGSGGVERLEAEELMGDG